MRLNSPLAVSLLGALAFTGALSAQSLGPVPLPDPRIAAFHFPENEATLTRWVTEQSRGTTAETRDAASARLYLHGWGLWTALTTETAQLSEGQRLLVFETWLTPDDLAADSDTTAASGLTPPASDQSTRAHSGPLRPALAGAPGPSQRPALRRSPLKPIAQLAVLRRDDDEPPAPVVPDTQIERIAGFTKFDPTAAAHVTSQQLLRLSTLDLLLTGGAQQVTPFPVTALAVKPVFQILRARDLIAGRYAALKAWSGPPDLPQPYAPSEWPGSVWIDVLGGGRGAGALESPSVPDGSARTDETTYPLNTLIHYRLSPADAAALNAAKPGTDASGGDFAVLVAMHVAGRELARWTWQTFWWTPSPEDPKAPSSPAIAATRPAQLRGAARHYAMAQAYATSYPNEPYVGGDNAAPVVYAYNPYIEARFAPSDLPDSRPGLDPLGRPAANNHGVQTNCLSCHIQANYHPATKLVAPRFTGARYVDLGAADFVGTLQTDFIWALPRHAK